MNYVKEGGYKSFVCLDFETTGFSPAADGITEIGAVKVLDGEIVQRFSTLVNPGKAIPYAVTRLTGITDRMVAGSPRIGEILPVFLGFLGSLPLVAHNARFDGEFLAHNLLKIHREIDNPMADTLQQARAVCPGLPSYKLGDLTAHFSIPLNNAHRAWCDAEATAKLYLRLQTL